MPKRMKYYMHVTQKKKLATLYVLIDNKHSRHGGYEGRKRYNMIIIDWLCNQRRVLDFKLYPVSDSIYVDDNFNLYKYIIYYDILVDLHCNDIDSALFIADNFTRNIWHVVAQMEYLDWKDLRCKDNDFFFNALKPIHIREEYEEKNSNASWLLFEFKGKFYGEFEKGITSKMRSNLIYLSSDYRTAKYMYEEYLALKGVKWKNEWNC